MIFLSPSLVYPRVHYPTLVPLATVSCFIQGSGASFLARRRRRCNLPTAFGVHLSAAYLWPRVCTRIYSLEYKFHRGPYTYLAARLYFNFEWGARVFLSHLFRSPFTLNPLSIGARAQLVPVVFRVDGTPSPLSRLQIFRVYKHRGPRPPLHGGYIPCRPFRSFHARIYRVSACHTDYDDKCTYLLTTVRLISLTCGDRRNHGKMKNVGAIFFIIST